MSEDQKTLLDQVRVTCLITFFLCAAMAVAAINQAGNGQSILWDLQGDVKKAECESLLALATLGQEPQYQAELHGVTRGLTPQGVRRLPQCKGKLP